MPSVQRMLYIPHFLVQGILAEIEKCDVLCANCHAIQHHKETT